MWGEGDAYSCGSIYSIEDGAPCPPVNYSSHTIKPHSICHADAPSHIIEGARGIDLYFDSDRKKAMYGDVWVVRFQQESMVKSSFDQGIVHFEVSLELLREKLTALGCKEHPQKLIITLDPYPENERKDHDPNVALTLSKESANWRIGSVPLSASEQMGRGDVSVQLLFTLVDDLVSEKRVQYRSKVNIEIGTQMDQSSYGVFSSVSASELKRVLSNLINNSVEAMNEEGKVTLSLLGDAQWATIVVSDNGKGIPDSIISQIGECGGTYDKLGGSGLGIFSARKVLESWGGGIKISSQVGIGTKVEIKLPRSVAPKLISNPMFCT